MSFLKQLGLNAAQGVSSQLTGVVGNTLSALLLGGFNGVKNMARGALGTGLTSAQKEANAWTAQREDTAYQRSVADMQAAGLNPALMYGSAGSTSPSASTSPSDGASLSDMLGSATSLSQIQSMNVQNKVSQRQTDIAQQNADTARYNAETERMSVEQGIEESKSRISLNAVEELYKRSGIALNEKQLDKLTAEINDLNSQVNYREAQILLHTIEMQIKKGQLKVNQDYYDFAVRKWNEGEKAECLAHIMLMEQQALTSGAEAYANDRMSDYYDEQGTYSHNKNVREEEWQNFYRDYLISELETKKEQFKEQLAQALKIANAQIDAAHLDKLADNLFNTVNTAMQTAGKLAGDLSTPFNIEVHESTRDVYQKGYKVGTEKHRSTTHSR